jgi:hypothetical protein
MALGSTQPLTEMTKYEQEWDRMIRKNQKKLKINLGDQKSVRVAIGYRLSCPLA